MNTAEQGERLTIQPLHQNTSLNNDCDDDDNDDNDHTLETSHVEADATEANQLHTEGQKVPNNIETRDRHTIERSMTQQSLTLCTVESQENFELVIETRSEEQGDGSQIELKGTLTTENESYCELVIEEENGLEKNKEQCIGPQHLEMEVVANSETEDADNSPLLNDFQVFGNNCDKGKATCLERESSLKENIAVVVDPSREKDEVFEENSTMKRLRK